MIGTDITVATNLLTSGELVAIPTETVYGLAANALNVQAVAKIFEVKKRPSFDPLIVHIKDIEEVVKYARNFPKPLRDLGSVFWPGALTILLEKLPVIPDLVTSGLGKVALRVPKHPLVQQLLASLDFPLAAPSANPFGYVSPTNAKHVEDQLGNEIPYILDGGQCGIGLESTIIGLENNQIVVYRQGGITIEELSKNTDLKIIIREHSSSNPAAPGMLKKHYSPRKNVEFWHENKKIENPLECGYLGFDKYIESIPLENQFLLSPNADLNLAAHRLFLGLRWLDSLAISKVYVCKVPNTGLGKAINDKLNRAAAD